MKYRDSAVATAAMGVPGALNVRHGYNIIFASDHHAYHQNIIKYSKRDFDLTDWKGMNEAIRDAHNKVVEDGDKVFFLGDFAYPAKFLIKAHGRHKIEEFCADFCRTFKGQIHYSEGNHEAFFRKVDLDWVRVPQLFELDILDGSFENGKKKLILCHYGFRTWCKAHKGAWHLYGHSHGGLKNDFGDRMQEWQNATSMDVGIDTNAMRPYTWADVKAHLNPKVFKPSDHHSDAMDFSERVPGDN